MRANVHHDVPAGTYQSQGTTAEIGYGNRQSAAGNGEGTGMAIGPHGTNQQRRER